MFLSVVAFKLPSLPTLSTTVQTRLAGHPALDAFGAFVGALGREALLLAEAGRRLRSSPGTDPA